MFTSTLYRKKLIKYHLYKSYGILTCRKVKVESFIKKIAVKMCIFYILCTYINKTA